MRRVLLWSAGVAAAGALVLAAWGVAALLERDAQPIPTAMVRRGTVNTDVHADGELRAVKSEVLIAPPAGAQLRILQMKMTGEAVAKGDVVVRFDPAEQEYRLEEQRSIEREAMLEIEKLDAEREAQAAQDLVDLASAQFELRKAELDVLGKDMLPGIDARKRELALDEARRRVEQLQQDVGARAKSSGAALAVAREKQKKAALAIAQAQRLLEQMTLRSGMTGIVSIGDNREGSYFFWGMTFSEYRQGDTVSSGRPVAEVLAAGDVELRARIQEMDRERVRAGQLAQVSLDAHGAEGVLEARVSHVGGISGGSTLFGGASGPTRLFDVTFTLPRVPAAARPGVSARVSLNGPPLVDVLYVPRQAVFEREGKSVVYVRGEAGFLPREVKVAARTPSVVALEQIDEGVEVALIEPSLRRRQAGRSSPSGPTRVGIQ